MRRTSPISLAVMAAILVVVFAPIVLSMTLHGNDLIANIRYALWWEQSGYYGRPRPHFLFQLLFVVLRSLIPGDNDIAFAAAMIGLASYLVLGLIFFVLMTPLLSELPPRIRGLTQVGLTLGFMVIGPINFLTWPTHHTYLGYIAPHAYHNPAQILSKPFVLLLFLLALRLFKGERAGMITLVSTAVIMVLCTLAKPNYPVSLLPAMALMTLFMLYLRRIPDWRWLFAGFVAPAATVLVWQYAYHHNMDMGGFVFAPLQVMGYYAEGEVLSRFILSILFPLLILILYFREAVHDTGLRLAWITFGFGAFYTYFLAETEGWTVSWTDGNFMWSGQITLLILFFSSILFFLRQSRNWDTKFLLSTIVLLLHIIGGIALYLPHLGSDWRLWL